MEVVLDRGDAPEAELVGGADQVRHAVDDLGVALDVAPQGTQPLALVLAGGGDDGIELQDRLDHGLLAGARRRGGGAGL
jgi:hypothetical protein